MVTLRFCWLVQLGSGGVEGVGAMAMAMRYRWFEAGDPELGWVCGGLTRASEEDDDDHCCES